MSAFTGQPYTRDDGVRVFPKTPVDAVDHTLDWSRELKVGQSIVSALWTVPAGLTGSNEGFTGTLATKRLTGGTAGTIYDVACRVTLNDGTVIERWIAIDVRTRLG